MENPPIVEAPPIQQPIVETPAVVTTPSVITTEKKGLKDLIPSQMEWLTIGFVALIGASYIMSILHYRKAIETSSSMMKLQEQLDNIKIVLQKNNLTAQPKK